MQKSSNIFVMILVFVLIGLNFIVISCPSDDDDNDNSPTSTPTQDASADIIPGQKLFDFYIDDDFSTCLDRYGEPSQYQHYGTYFVCNYENPEFGMTVEDVDSNGNLTGTDKIVEITIYNWTNWDGKTQGGNGIGSTREQIIDEFGPCEISDENNCKYPSIGIGWGFWSSQAECFSVSVEKIGLGFKNLSR